MISIEDFKKLLKYNVPGYMILLNNYEVCLSYDDTPDEDGELFEGNEWWRCSFTYSDDKYTTVFDNRQFKDNDVWRVQKLVEIDWKNDIQE